MTSRRRLHDERGLAAGSLLRWVVVLAILGLVLVEAGSIFFTYLSVQSAADAAAVRAVDEWEQNGNLRAAQAAARAELDLQEHEEARIASFEAGPAPTYEVRLTVTETASTLLVHRISALAGLARVRVEAVSRATAADV